MRRALVLLAALLLPACGGEEGLDQKDPQAVFRAAMEAVHDADWKTLRTLLTKEARREMERDLGRLKRRLGHPEDGIPERALAKQRLGERDEEEIQRVVAGGPAAALRFCVLIMPRERSPQPRGMKVEPLARTILYSAADGTQRPVRLVQVLGKWLIADLQL